MCVRAHPEVGENVSSLDILSTELDLPVGLILVLLKVSQAHFKHTALQTIRGNLEEQTKGTVGFNQEECQHQAEQAQCTLPGGPLLISSPHISQLSSLKMQLYL